ncbi:hypothetical protein CLOP_g24631 [Closterium sp. NIES-67]|nr:hypothetical protein CLOP_g24631 [Closterium sp. NIES-67]
MASDEDLHVALAAAAAAAAHHSQARPPLRLHLDTTEAPPLPSHTHTPLKHLPSSTLPTSTSPRHTLPATAPHPSTSAASHSAPPPSMALSLPAPRRDSECGEARQPAQRCAVMHKSCQQQQQHQWGQVQEQRQDFRAKPVGEQCHKAGEARGGGLECVGSQGDPQRCAQNGCGFCVHTQPHDVMEKSMWGLAAWDSRTAAYASGVLMVAAAACAAAAVIGTRSNHS